MVGVWLLGGCDRESANNPTEDQARSTERLSAIEALASDEPGAGLEAATRYADYVEKFGDDGLLLRLLRHESPVIRKNAVLAITYLNMHCETGPLRKAMDDPEWEVRRAALRALTQMKPKEARLPILLSLKDAHWQVRAEAVSCLALTGSPSDAAKLLGMTDDDDEFVRHEALKGLELMLKKYGEEMPRELASAVREAIGAEPVDAGE